MFLQINKRLAVNLNDVSAICAENYNEGEKKFAIHFIGSVRDVYNHYETEKERDFAFDEMLRLIGAIEWNSD